MIRPLNENIVVRPEQAPEKIGSLYIPEAFQEKANRNQDGVLTAGEVVATGPGELSKSGTRIPIALEIGERVIFPLCSATEIGDGLLVLHQCHVYGVVPADADVRGMKIMPVREPSSRDYLRQGV